MYLSSRGEGGMFTFQEGALVNKVKGQEEKVAQVEFVVQKWVDSHCSFIKCRVLKTELTES